MADTPSSFVQDAPSSFVPDAPPTPAVSGGVYAGPELGVLRPPGAPAPLQLPLPWETAIQVPEPEEGPGLITGR